MNYLISFVDDQQSERHRLLDVCIVEAETRVAALAAARSVCSRTTPARVVLIPQQIAIDPGDLGRRIPLGEASALCQRLEKQMSATDRHGSRR